MPIIWSALMPHPPILIPDVGGTRAAIAQKSSIACRELAKDFIASQPELLVLISPHAPRPRRGIGYFAGQVLMGDFAKFGAPERAVHLPNASDWLRIFCEQTSVSFPLSPLNNQSLDHGATVPLYFLCQAGWTGPTVVLGLPWDSGAILEHLGDAIAGASQAGSVAVLASGDMSHCLDKAGPYGFHPSGPKFDAWFVQALSTGTFPDFKHFPKSTLDEAKQDVLESSRVAWQTLSPDKQAPALLSYEGPFGVGYSVAKFGGSPL